MCGLFGYKVYGKQENKNLKVLVKSLAINSMERGTDATGIAFPCQGGLKIEKASVPADEFKFVLPKFCKDVLGHTRRTTQGDAKKNYNNHPFEGKAGKTPFAFAHNGVLDNEFELRDEYGLKETKIQTDSYVACQLAEKLGLGMENLKKLGEAVEGMFAFTFLDKTGTLSIVKNDSPFTIAHFPTLKLYVYASTENILIDSLMEYAPTNNIITNSLVKGELEVEFHQPEVGTIIQIDKDGKIENSKFEPLERCTYNPLYAVAGGWGNYSWDRGAEESKRYFNRKDYSDRYNDYDLASFITKELRAVLKEEDIDLLVDFGFDHEYIYDMLMDDTLDSILTSLKSNKYKDISADDLNLLMVFGYDAEVIKDLYDDGLLDDEILFIKKQLDKGVKY